MSINMNYAPRFAESDAQTLHPYTDFDRPTASGSHSERPCALDVSASTQQVWHDYLAQLDVSAAILTAHFPGSPPQRHAVLIGLDAARNNPGATRALLAVAECLWARAGQQSACQFHLSGHDIAMDPVPGAVDEPVVADLLAAFDHGAIVQRQHEGATVRALYLRRRGFERFSAQEIGSLQLILPLFADSAAGGARLARQAQRSAMLEAMFDRVSLSMMLLTADSQPLFMNSAATALVDERKWLIRSADGSIAGINPKQSKQLREAIHRAASAESDAPPVENVFRLDCRDGEWRLAYVLSAKSGDAEARCAMLIILAPGKMDAPTQLLKALGLLPSEQRFLGHFLKSSSLGNAASDCGLSEETARTYLKRVRAKLGVHRQMELAGLISGLVLPLQSDAARGEKE